MRVDQGHSQNKRKVDAINDVLLLGLGEAAQKCPEPNKDVGLYTALGEFLP